MACRNINKANIARDKIIDNLQLPNGDNLIVMELDLASLNSVYNFCKQFMGKGLNIDYLINNAGVMALPQYTETNDGYEKQFQVNHLSHFYLTHLLLPKLKESKARVISVSSTAHAVPDYKTMDSLLDYCNDNGCFMGDKQSDYEPRHNYGISKLSNLLFARRLHELYHKDGIVSVSCHPGFVPTELGRNVPKLKLIGLLLGWFLKPQMIRENLKSISQGTATQLRCVSMDINEIKGGHYYFNCQSGNDNNKLSDAASKNDGILENKLWDLSQLLIKQKNMPTTL